MASRKEQQDAFDKALKFFEDSIESHDALMVQVDKRSDAYHAMKNKREDKGWRSQLFPPYAMHIVDSTLASMIEDKLTFRVKPRVQLWDAEEDPQAEMAKAKMGAEAHQILFDWQVRQSKWTRVQRPFLLQNSIAGITVAKNYWTDRTERRRVMSVSQEPLTDEYGDPVIDPYTGQPMTHPTMKEETKVITVYDGPETEVIDIHDFFWPKNARSIQQSRFVAHRIWMSREDLEESFKEGGPYGPDHGGWTKKKVFDTIGDARSQADQRGQRWSEKGETTHDWDNLEVVEVWDSFTKEVITFVNRTALLTKKQFPFFHEQPPFVVCTTQPDLFQPVGISQIEKVQALQQMLWDLGNQRMDNLQLINNAIVIFNPSMENPEELEFYPGAMWPIEDPELVNMWQPVPIPAEISLGAEALLKGDMQNLASTFPFSSGAESQTVDQKTATGASIVSSLAQRSIDMAKQPVYDAWQDCGQQRLILNQQFIREPTAASVLGLDGEEEIQVVMPELLAGDFEFILDPMPDALEKQEKQAQAQSMVQVLGQLAPMILPLAQAGAASMINFDAVLEFYFKSMDIEDTKQFFIKKPPATSLAPQGSPGGGQGEQSLGITAGPRGQEPGSQMNDSPVQNLQRAAALSGGGQSV